jgi:hypothetical protein
LARRRFGLAPFRSPLLRPLITSSGYMRCFSSPAYPHPDYVFIRGSQGSPPCGVPPFGDPRLPARARLPEAFRCYATSFFGTNGLGIHPTPSLTVCTSTRDRGVAPVAAGPCHTAHINHPLTHYLSPRARHTGARRSLLRSRPHSSLLKVHAVVPDCCLIIVRQQTATVIERGMVEMRRLELLTPSVQRRCSPN